MIRFIQIMSLINGLFTQVNDIGPNGLLFVYRLGDVCFTRKIHVKNYVSRKARDT